MKSLTKLCALTLPFFSFACVNGSGSYYEGELEVMAQLSEAHEDHEEESHWHLEHVHLHVAGIQLRKDRSDFTQTWDDPTSAELSEDPAEIFHFKAVANVEYDEVQLILGEGISELHEHAKAEEEEDESHEHKLSSFSLEALRESETPCALHLELHKPGLKIPTPLAEAFTVARDQTQSLLIHIDLHHLLERLPIEALCAESGEVHISEEENVDLYAEALEHFQEIFSAEFLASSEEAEEDSGHNHGHNH